MPLATRLQATGIALFALACASLALRSALAAAETPRFQLARDSLLQVKLERLVHGFRGRVGIYVRHLPSGSSAAIDADSLFPTASMIKVPILIGRKYCC